jgi:translation initiation factor IF-2
MPTSVDIDTLSEEQLAAMLEMKKERREAEEARRRAAEEARRRATKELQRAEEEAKRKAEEEKKKLEERKEAEREKKKTGDDGDALHAAGPIFPAHSQPSAAKSVTAAGPPRGGVHFL